jgi:hypothetical protein
MITDENIMGDYKPRLIIFAFMKQIIHDFYNYVQVYQIFFFYLDISIPFF